MGGVYKTQTYILVSCLYFFVFKYKQKNMKGANIMFYQIKLIPFR